MQDSVSWPMLRLPPVKDVHAMALRMKAAIEIKDRLWRDLKVYRGSFLGTEAARWLERETGDKNDGLRWGNSMIQLGFCHHVCFAHQFEAGTKTLYYVWDEEALRDAGTRESLTWLERQVTRLARENSKANTELNETLFRQALLEERVVLLERFVGFVVASILVGLLSGSTSLGSALVVLGAIPLWGRSKIMAKLEDTGGEEEDFEGISEKAVRRLTEAVTLREVSEGDEDPIRQREVVPRLSAWPHRPALLCDDKDGGPLSVGTPFEFESELFKGTMLVRLKGVQSDDPRKDRMYFNGRQRRFQAIVQGR